MSAAEPVNHGYTVRRLVQFGRTLREAGLAVGAQQLSELANALTAIDLARQNDFYFTLRSFLVHNNDEREVFDRLFELFWLGHSGLLMEMGVSQKRSTAMLPERTHKTVIQQGRSRAFRARTTPQPATSRNRTLHRPTARWSCCATKISEITAMRKRPPRERSCNASCGGWRNARPAGTFGPASKPRHWICHG